MNQEQTVILVTLIAYKVVLILIGIISSRMTKDTTDFYLGGRKMGALVAAISASASSSSAWSLLGVSGAAYLWGVGAIWIIPACVGGFIVNWYVLAPRVREYSREENSLTLVEFLAGPEGSSQRKIIGRIGGGIILFSLLFYVAAQFQASGKTFESTFELGYLESVLIGSAIILFYTALGGFWAVSLTDTLQGLVMALSAILLPLTALYYVGGISGFISGVQQVPVEGFASFTRNLPMMTGIGFVLGLLGIGLGYPGQPHVINRFMALKDEKSLRSAQKIALFWAICVYIGMFTLGVCGRILQLHVEDQETILFEVAQELLHPVLGGIITAAVLSAIMSTADSQLLVAASSVTHDINLGKFHHKEPIWQSRAVVTILSIGAVIAAIFGSDVIFSRVLFAWTAMGAAFGPLLVARILHGQIRSKFKIAAMITGFVLGVTAYNIPETKGGPLERVLPFLVAYWIAYTGRESGETQQEIS